MTLDFGSVRLGVTVTQEVTISNAGELDLRVTATNLIGADASSNADDFSLIQAEDPPYTIEPNNSRLITVSYTPTDATPDLGYLQILSNDENTPEVKVELRSERKGRPEVRVDPAVLHFGDVPVGTASAPLAFTIANQGTGDAVLTVEEVFFRIALNPDFDLEVVDAGAAAVALPAYLNIGEALTVKVTYHPQEAGDDSDEILVITDDTLTPSFEVSLTGRGVVGDVSVDPSPADVGRVRVNTLGELVLTVSNSGGAPLELTGIALAGTSLEWSLDSIDVDLPNLDTAPHLLDPAASAELTLGFRPTDASVETGELVIDHTGPGAQLKTTLSAEGYIPPKVWLDPDPPALDFGDVQLDVATSLFEDKTLSLTIRNDGGEALQITAVERATGTSDEFTWDPATIPLLDPGQTTSLQVTFTPANSGEESGLLLVDTNDPDLELDTVTGRFAIDVTGRGLDSTIFVFPSGSHDFGNVFIGDLRTFTVTIRNASNDPLGIEDIRLAAAGSPDFTLQNVPALTVLIPDSVAEETFDVQFQPSAAGPVNGAVEIVSTDLGSPLVTIPLAGTGSDCPTGWGDCNHDPGDGCERSLTTLTDCGDCDVPCNLPNATETCENGTCELIVCEGDYADCDPGLPGCETNLTATEQHVCTGICVSNNDPDHCGDYCSSCETELGVVGNGYYTCPAGTCDIACDDGYHLCTDVCMADDETRSCGTRCTPCTEPPANGHATCVEIAEDTWQCDIECDDNFIRDGDTCVPSNTILCCGAACVNCTLGLGEHRHALCEEVAPGDWQCDSECDDDYWDIDGDGGDCEYHCVFLSSDDEPEGTYTDANCDGIDGTVSRAVFVAEDGDDGGAGTMDDPFLTIQHGIAQAALWPGIDHVYVSHGRYDEQVSLQNGISVWGKFARADDWQRADPYHTTIHWSTVASGRIVGVQASSITGATTFGAMIVETGPAAGTDYGVSNYGFHCSLCTDLTIVDCTITAGDAGPGRSGTSGTAGGNGGDGGHGGTPIGDTGGSAGTPGTSSCGRPGGSGGKGGNAGHNNGASGWPGTTAGAGGGAGGGGGDWGDCPWDGDPENGGNAGPGAAGGPGADGAGALPFGTTSGGYWTGFDGADGENGTHGHGGGGGGGGGSEGNNCHNKDAGGGGGGGGGGGCGGTLGTGGTAGGGSFGLYLDGSTGIQLLNNTIQSGSGGNGGSGGSGGTGGSEGGGGGSGAGDGGAGNGGTGGAGGSGGRGGHGGGGAGGLSYGVFRIGTAISLPGSNSLFHGPAGNGGTSPSHNGAAGTAANSN